MVNRIKCSDEVKKDRDSAFTHVDRMVHVIKSAKMSCSSRMILAVSWWVRVEIGRCKDVGLEA